MGNRKLLSSVLGCASLVLFQVAVLPAGAQVMLSEPSQAAAAAYSHWNVSGQWRFFSNDTPGTLTLRQEPSQLRCKRVTGIMDVPNDYSNVIGLYCPSDLRLYIGRYKQGESTPFQMYEGYVAYGSGKYMAGSFFYWGNEGPEGIPTLPFLGERQ